MVTSLHGATYQERENSFPVYRSPIILLRSAECVKDRRGYCQLKEEALGRTMWRNRFGRGFGPVV